MPILTYQLVAGQHDDAAIGELLLRSARLFAEVTESPVERIRVFADERPASRVCVGGALVSESGACAPFFTFWLMEGRPVEQRHRLLAGFTALLAEALGVDPAHVRGVVQVASPSDWAIAGVPASVVRQREIEARAAAAAEES